VENDERAREVAERLAELSRLRERGQMTEWEYHEASRLLLEGTDEAFPGPETDRYLPSDHAYATWARKRARAKWVRLGALVVVLGGAAVAVWFFMLRPDGAAETQAAPASTTAGDGSVETTVPVTTTAAGGGQTVTTTTVPSQLLQVAEAVRGQRSSAEEIRADAEAANALWEERTATYATTHDEFVRIAGEAGALAEDAAAYPAPTGFVRDYQLTVTVLEEFAEAASGLVTGLEASDDGTRRREALEALVTADRAHDAAVTALLTLLGVEDVPQPAL